MISLFIWKIFSILTANKNNTITENTIAKNILAASIGEVNFELNFLLIKHENK